jgi:hypothetical protein
MRTSTSQNLLLYTTFILLLSTFAAAWPWPRFLPEIDALIVRRQDEGTIGLCFDLDEEGKAFRNGANSA